MHAEKGFSSKSLKAPSKFALLPWRETKDPYKIWLSEIILQQTRVEQGISYYHKFITRFPTVNSLALASENEVLKLWQGLGYYSRARNLHHSSKIIVNDFNGNFPKDYKSILKLKGIGIYTAAAISSIRAFITSRAPAAMPQVPMWTVIFMFASPSRMEVLLAVSSFIFLRSSIVSFAMIFLPCFGFVCIGSELVQ